MSGVLDALKKTDTSALIDAIKADGPATKIISWPNRENIKVELKILNASESRQAKILNQKEFSREGLEIGMHNLADYRASEAAHGMWRAILDPDTHQPVFSSAEEFRSFLTDDEISYFVNAYNALSSEEDPNKDLSDSDYDELIELLKKKQDLIPSRVISLPMAWRLLRIMVNQVSK